MKNILISVAAVLVLSSGVALAADPAPAGGLRGACKADVEKLCPGIQPGGGRIAGCLKQNEAQVSAACKEAMGRTRAKKAPAAPT